MHIAVDASRATRATRTGTERYARETIERLVKLPLASGTRWTLFFDTDPGPWLEGAAHVDQVALPQRPMWTYRALAPALLRLRPDVFWEPAHVLPPTAPLARIPSLVTVHDLGYEHFPHAHTATQRLYLKLTTRYHARCATQIAADSEATRRDLVTLYGAPPSKVTVVPLGIDHTSFRPVEESERLSALRARFGLQGPYLLYIGTLQPRKNLNRLLRAFARVAPSFPEVRLVLAGGKGWMADGLQAQLAGLGITGRVHFLGYIPDEDLPALLSAAEALVFPSLFEGFGLPVLEAMACGTPVLTSATSSLPEVAGDAAILVNPTDEQQIADGMRLLLSQPPLRTALRERGLAQARQFTWERTAEMVFQLLEGLSKKG